VRCRNLLCLFALMARKNNPINDIINTVGGWLGGRGPGTNPQVQAAMQATRAVGKVVDTATGGFGQALVSDAQRMAQSGSSTPSALYKTAAVNLGAAAAGVGAAKVAGKAASSVSRAYKTAKETAVPSRMVLYHGGPAELKGGVIDPSFVRGSVASEKISGNVAALNQRSLDLVPQTQWQLEQNAKFLEDQLKIPGSFASQNAAKVQKDIDKLRRSSSDLGAWTNRAKQENYFTGVGSASDTYWHSGSVHVVSPRRADVQTGLGPGGEYQIVGKQKPVASFPTGGRPGEQANEAMRLAQQAGDALQKKLKRQAVIKQTAKNLRPKKK
jgi:hypothetical protein